MVKKKYNKKSYKIPQTNKGNTDIVIIYIIRALKVTAALHRHSKSAAIVVRQ